MNIFQLPKYQLITVIMHIIQLPMNEELMAGQLVGQLMNIGTNIGQWERESLW